MKPLATFVFLFLAVTSTFAQDNPQALIQYRPAVHVSIMPVVQVWEVEGEYFGELSIPVAVHVPLGRALSLSLLGRGAAVDGTDLEPLDGLADTQVALNYRRQIGRSMLMLTLGASLPSGKRELTNEEFSTAFLLGQNVYRFQVASFGQGRIVSPGVLVAVPLNERVVVGFGGSYQAKESYRPLASFAQDYNPGNEILLTGGLDVRLAPTTYLSSDVIFTMYDKDTLGEEEVFGAGQKAVVSAQIRHAFGFHELWLLGRFRSRAKNEVLIGSGLVEEAEKSIPNQTEVMGHLRLRFSQNLYVRFLIDGRFFDESPSAERINLYGGGISLELAFSTVTIPLRFKYFFGDFSGVEGGLGLLLTL